MDIILREYVMKIRLISLSKKFSKSILLTLCFFMLFSCATTVNVRLTRPAQLDLNGARTIAVLPFKPGQYYVEYDTSLGKTILINTFYQIFDIKNPDEQLILDSLRGQIERGLLDSPYIKLVSSDSVERAIKKGTLNPADVYLTGEVSYFNIEDHYGEEKKLIKPETDEHKAEYAIVPYWVREVSLVFRYQVVDSSSDKVIAYDAYRCNVSSSRIESRKAMPSAYSLLESDIKKAAKKILQELQPYTVTKSIKLLESKTKDKSLKERMKAADELADNSMLEKASAEFTKIYEETGLVEAGYNAAILQEALGNLSLAEEMMLEVYQRYPDNRVAKGLDDIRYEINQANRLNKQISASEASGDLDDLDDFDDSEDLDF